MKVKKILFILGVSFFLGGLFSCANGNGPVLEESEQEKTEEEKTESGSIKGVSFNISDLTSLAIADETTATRSAARSTVSEGMLVKLLEDGTVENFINVPEGVTLAPVSFVTQSPASNSKEIYIVFEYSSGWYEPVEKTDEWGNTWTEEWGNYVTLGRLLCVYEDGSFVDVLATEDGLWKDLCNNGNQDSPIKFDGQGNMYYQVWESAGNSSTSMIYKFDPKKKESKQLTPQVPNVSYEQFYVSTDGNWIFAKASRYNSSGSSANYLRAIPVSDADNPVNLFYDSTGSKWLDQWIYDEISKNVYYTIDSGLYRIPYKNGTYNQESKELILGNEEYINIDGCVYWNELFKDNDIFVEYKLANSSSATDINNYYSYKDYYFVDADTLEMDYQEILDYHFGLLYNVGGHYFYGYRNNYEIRFDEFANIKGFEELALKTKDENGNSLTDLELIKAIFEKDLIQLLGKAMDTYYTETNIYNEYKHNYIADIMYLKESGEKIDFTKFSIYSSKNNSFSAANGCLNFDKYEYYANWKDEFVNSDTGSVEPEKILSFLAKKCGVEEIDFSLECFKNDANFNELYTDKKNKEAIMFVNSSRKRIDLLYRFIGSNYNVFLNKTCFLPGTDTPACNINNGDNKTPINYWSLENFTLVGQTLYASDRNNNGKLVMLIDENANPVGKFLDIDYESELKVASTLVHNGVFYFQNALVNASGDEIGAHKILRLDPTASSIEDMFYNMPNNTTFEVVSYTVGGQNLYCCLTKGTEIQTVKIDVKTRQYTQLASGTKFKQIIVVK